MKDEKKVLGILAIVFGGIAIVGSWVPILNNVSFFIAIVALILGVIALIVNRKNKKVLAIVGTCLSIASIIIVLATQSMYSNAIDEASKAFDETSKSIDKEYSESSIAEESSSIAAEKAADDAFKWTDAYFDSIVDGTTTYDEIVATVGEPTTTSTDTDYDFDSDSEVPAMDCDWDLEDGSYYASVSIHFVQKNGTYVVDSKTGTGLK